MRWFLALVVFFGVAGCLDIDSPDGSLKCSNDPKRLCPEGYYCLAGDNTCWRIGHFPEDMAEPFQGFPGGGGDDLSASMDDMSTELDLGTPDDQTPPNDDLSQTD